MGTMTLTGAIGRLEPAPSQLPGIRAGLERLTADPGGALVPVSRPYPAGCLDGRPFEIPDMPAAARVPDGGSTPRVAGGTLTTWVVDVLLTGVFRPVAVPGRGTGARRRGERPEGPPPVRETGADPAGLGEEIATWAPAWLSLTCASLRAADLPVSAHGDDHAAPGNSGCGAVDSVATILGLLGQRPPGVVALMESWGIDVADVPEAVLRRCGALALTMPDGDDIAGVISGYADSPMPIMHGPHREVAVVANTVPGTTIDAAAVGAALDAAGAGPGVGTGAADAEPPGEAGAWQVFAVDTWAFGSIADFYRDQAADGGRAPASHDQIVATAAAFNAAALLTLCAADMPVAVLRTR